MKSKEFLYHIVIAFIVEFAIILLGIIIQLIFGKSSQDLLRLFLGFRVPMWAIFLAILIVYPTFRIFYKTGHRNKPLIQDIIEYDIKINYPIDGSTVKSPIEAVGSYKIAPIKNNIYTIELNPELNLYWPKNQIIFNSKNKTWSSKLSIGGGDYKRRRLIIAEVTDAGIAFINYYRLVSSPGAYKGIKDFGTVIRILDEVNITLEP